MNTNPAVPTVRAKVGVKLSAKSSANTRLLAAAVRVFERDGLRGATTREIARVAGVNEVTLFRHFRNKDGLLAAVMAHKMETHTALLEMDSIWTGDFHRDLRAYAHSFYRALGENEAFIRMLIGEARRQPDFSRQMMIDAARPTRERFVEHLKQAVKAGIIRDDLDLRVVGDAFNDMLLFSMLRDTAQWMPLYKAEKYVDTCVTLFLSALTAKPVPAKSGKQKPAAAKPRAARTPNGRR